jgi:hypothetical protein
MRVFFLLIFALNIVHANISKTMVTNSPLILFATSDGAYIKNMGGVSIINDKVYGYADKNVTLTSYNSKLLNSNFKYDNNNQNNLTFVCVKEDGTNLQDVSLLISNNILNDVVIDSLFTLSDFNSLYKDEAVYFYIVADELLYKVTSDAFDVQNNKVVVKQVAYLQHRDEYIRSFYQYENESTYSSQKLYEKIDTTSFRHITNFTNINSESNFTVRALEDLSVDYVNNTKYNYELAEKISDKSSLVNNDATLITYIYKLLEQTKYYHSSLVDEDIKDVIRSAHYNYNDYQIQQMYFNDFYEESKAPLSINCTKSITYSTYLNNKQSYFESIILELKTLYNFDITVLEIDEFFNQFIDSTYLQVKFSKLEEINTYIFGDYHTLLIDGGFEWSCLKQDTDNVYVEGIDSVDKFDSFYVLDKGVLKVLQNNYTLLIKENERTGIPIIFNKLEFKYKAIKDNNKKFIGSVVEFDFIEIIRSYKLTKKISIHMLIVKDDGNLYISKQNLMNEQNKKYNRTYLDFEKVNTGNISKTKGNLKFKKIAFDGLDMLFTSIDNSVYKTVGFEGFNEEVYDNPITEIGRKFWGYVKSNVVSRVGLFLNKESSKTCFTVKNDNSINYNLYNSYYMHNIEVVNAFYLQKGSLFVADENNDSLILEDVVDIQASFNKTRLYALTNNNKLYIYDNNIKLLSVVDSVISLEDIYNFNLASFDSFLEDTNIYLDIITKNSDGSYSSYVFVDSVVRVDDITTVYEAFLSDTKISYGEEDVVDATKSLKAFNSSDVVKNIAIKYLGFDTNITLTNDGQVFGRGYFNKLISNGNNNNYFDYTNVNLNLVDALNNKLTNIIDIVYDNVNNIIYALKSDGIVYQIGHDFSYKARELEVPILNNLKINVDKEDIVENLDFTSCLNENKPYYILDIKSDDDIDLYVGLNAFSSSLDNDIRVHFKTMRNANNQLLGELIVSDSVFGKTLLIASIQNNKMIMGRYSMDIVEMLQKAVDSNNARDLMKDDSIATLVIKERLFTVTRSGRNHVSLKHKTSNGRQIVITFNISESGIVYFSRGYIIETFIRTDDITCKF